MNERTPDAMDRLNAATRELVHAAVNLRETEPCHETDLIFALCSGVAGCLLDPGGWESELEPLVLALREKPARPRENPTPEARLPGKPARE